MDSAVHDRRLATDVLHNVDLAAGGPASRCNVVTEHPECRPDSLPIGDLDSRFEPAVGLGESSQGLQPRGCVLAGDAVGSGIVFGDGANHQHAVLDRSIRRPRCVGFEFLVAPAATAGIVGPFRRVDGWPVELVMPGQNPVVLRQGGIYDPTREQEQSYTTMLE